MPEEKTGYAVEQAPEVQEELEEPSLTWMHVLAAIGAAVMLFLVVVFCGIMKAYRCPY